MLYTPKVGDVIRVKDSSSYYTIMIIVNELVGILSSNSSSISFTSNFDGYFDKSRVIFPKEKFVPLKGQQYYYPVFDNGIDIGYGVSMWQDGKIGCGREIQLLQQGMIFNNKEEAVEARDKMIASLK